MRLPEEGKRWKSDGRTIELDLNDPAMTLNDTPGDEPTAHRFAAWLRSNGWTVSTQHRGPMRVGAGLRIKTDLSPSWNYCCWMSFPIQTACIRRPHPPPDPHGLLP